MTLQPWVTVVTPLYNYKHYIKDCIQSVLDQTYPYVEHIIVDDGSTDGGPEWVESFAQTNDRVRLIRQKRNGYGVSRAVNTAISEAKGEFISWLAADDYFLPDKTSHAVEVFLENQNKYPKFAGVYTEALLETSDLSTLHHPRLPMDEMGLDIAALEAQILAGEPARWPAGMMGFNSNADLLYYSLHGNRINGCTTLIPKTVYQDVGGFYESWALTHDFELWLRMIFKGYHFHYSEHAGVVSRYHITNTSRYDSDVPEESYLCLKHIADHLRPEDILAPLKTWYPNDPESGFYHKLATVFEHLRQKDYALRYALKFRKLNPTGSQKIEQIIEDYSPLFSQEKPLHSPPSEFLMVISDQGISWRLQAVLTQFFLGIQQGCLHICVDESVKSQCLEKLESIAIYLNQEMSALLNRIVWEPFPQSPESLFQKAGIFIPIANPGLLEQQFIDYYKKFGVVCFQAESHHLARAQSSFKAIMRQAQHAHQELLDALFLMRRPQYYFPKSELLITADTALHVGKKASSCLKGLSFPEHLDQLHPFQCRLGVWNTWAYQTLKDKDPIRLSPMILCQPDCELVSLQNILDFDAPDCILFDYSSHDETQWKLILKSFALEPRTIGLGAIVYIPESESLEQAEEQILSYISEHGLNFDQRELSIIEENQLTELEKLSLHLQLKGILYPLENILRFQNRWAYLSALRGALPILAPPHTKHPETSPYIFPYAPGSDAQNKIIECLEAILGFSPDAHKSHKYLIDNQRIISPHDWAQIVVDQLDEAR